MGFMADSPAKRPRNKRALASVRVSDGSTPRFLQGPFEFEGNGLDKPSLIDESLRYVVPAGAVHQPVDFLGGWWRISRPTRCWSCMSPRRADAVGRSLSTSAWSKSDERLREEAKALMAQKLVVVGNGMAGGRAIEEILLRSGPQTGSETFEITVFGDEPYGNYNRILLSNVLAGSQDIEADAGDI